MSFNNPDSTTMLEESNYSDSGVFDETFKSQANAESCTQPVSQIVSNSGSTHHQITAEQQKLIDHARRQFNINRKVIIKNTPPCVYGDVKSFLGKYAVKNILVSKKHRHAVVWLCHGSQAEEICRNLNNKCILGHPVEVSLYRNENFLCVANLPLNMDEEEFNNLVSELGLIERAFLMRDHQGRSKGYGFVEYSHNFEKTKQACTLLDSKRIGSCALNCEFIKEHIVTFSQLHSSCLLVDHLPPNYNDFDEFNQIFSTYEKPVYCRLGSEGGQPLGFGIVEYPSYEKAAVTFTNLHRTRINNHVIRVSYCIPGMSASEVYEKKCSMLETQRVPRFGGLLPDPGILTTPSVRGQSSGTLANPVMKSLLSSSPKVLNNFQSVLSRIRSRAHSQPEPIDDNTLLDERLQVSILACIMAQQLEQTQPAIFQNPVVQNYLKTNSENTPFFSNKSLAQADNLLRTLSTTYQSKQSQRSGLRRPPGDASDDTLTDFNSILNAVDFESRDIDNEQHPGLHGSEPNFQETAPTTARNNHFCNPILAVIIESQIQQQLQNLPSFNFLSSVTGTASSFPPAENVRGPLLGNFPGDASFQERFSGQRRGLMGDAPPGHISGDHGQYRDDRRQFRGRGGFRGRGRRYFENERDYRGNHGGGLQGTGQGSVSYQEMVQVYQQYLEQVSRMQKEKLEDGAAPSGVTPGIDNDSSDAVYSSGIANQPAFSTGVTSGRGKPQNSQALPLEAFISQLTQLSNQLQSMQKSGQIPAEITQGGNPLSAVLQSLTGKTQEQKCADEQNQLQPVDEDQTQNLQSRNFLLKNPENVNPNEGQPVVKNSEFSASDNFPFEPLSGRNFPIHGSSQMAKPLMVDDVTVIPPIKKPLLSEPPRKPYGDWQQNSSTVPRPILGQYNSSKDIHQSDSQDRENYFESNQYSDGSLLGPHRGAQRSYASQRFEPYNMKSDDRISVPMDRPMKTVDDQFSRQRHKYMDSYGPQFEQHFQETSTLSYSDFPIKKPLIPDPVSEIQSDRYKNPVVSHDYSSERELEPLQGRLVSEIAYHNVSQKAPLLADPGFNFQEQPTGQRHLTEKPPNHSLRPTHYQQDYNSQYSKTYEPHPMIRRSRTPSPPPSWLPAIGEERRSRFSESSDPGYDVKSNEWFQKEDDFGNRRHRSDDCYAGIGRNPNDHCNQYQKQPVAKIPLLQPLDAAPRDWWKSTNTQESRFRDEPSDVRERFGRNHDGADSRDNYTDSGRDSHRQYQNEQYGARSKSSKFNPSLVSTPVSHWQNERLENQPLLGQKRPLLPHLLPSPEQSPEGDYIGQHSQGLGGHYAASYKKRRL